MEAGGITALWKKYPVRRVDSVNVVVECYNSMGHCQGGGCSEMFSQTLHGSCCQSMEPRGYMSRRAIHISINLNQLCISLTHALTGSDMHLSAEFCELANVDCTIKGSFFFDPTKCPGFFEPTDVVQLVGVEIQDWNGSAQLSGRNVSITSAHK